MKYLPYIAIIGGVLFLCGGSVFIEPITDGTTTVYCDRVLHMVAGVKIVATQPGTYSVDLTSICAYPT